MLASVKAGYIGRLLNGKPQTVAGYALEIQTQAANFL
jgi:hypothetical protein